MEAFAWLPPGSYPMAADSLFELAAAHLQHAIQTDGTCSILRSLVSNEDSILDSASFSRACSPGQLSGAKDLENDIITLTCEVSYHFERESALYHNGGGGYNESPPQLFRGSEVLGMMASDGELRLAPTPLHEVGTWRRPVTPSYSAKVRLVDAAIQAFAATFSLKSGKEQQTALQMLESLVPPAYFQVSRAIGVSTSLAEQERGSKVSLFLVILTLSRSLLNSVILHRSSWPKVIHLWRSLLLCCFRAFGQFQ